MAAKRCIMKMPKCRKKWAAAFFLLLALAAAALWLLPVPAVEPVSSEKLKAAAEGLNAYQVTLRLNDQEHSLAISQTLNYQNDTGVPLDNLVLRTWLNAFETEESSPAALEEIYDACYPEGFSPGFLTLYDVIWNGERAEHGYLDGEKTALEIEIPSLLPGEQGTLEIRAVAFLPYCAYRTGYTDAGYQLGNILPLLSVYENGAWRMDPYSPVGDPFLSECANFSIVLHAPEGYVPACSALLAQREDGAWQGEILAARDVGLCLSKEYELAQGKQDGTIVSSYATTKEGAKRGLVLAQKALETFSALYGEYPYPAFSVCSAQFPFGGMEYPGLCMVEEGYYLESREDSLELVIAHETAHQWFYGMVGSDQVNHPWQDEALCEYAMLRYVQKRYGQGSFENLKYYRVDAPMQEVIPGALTPGSPIDYFASLAEYSSVVYGRGAALLLALDEILPKGADDFLRAYAENFAFSYVTRADFEAFLQRYGGMDLSPLLLDYLDTAFSS